MVSIIEQRVDGDTSSRWRVFHGVTCKDYG